MTNKSAECFAYWVKCRTCHRTQRVVPSFVVNENGVRFDFDYRYVICDKCGGMAVPLDYKWKLDVKISSPEKEKKMELHLEILDILKSNQTDFMRQRAIVAATKSTQHQVVAALFKLRSEGQAGLIIAPDGTGWWYPIP